MTVEEIIPCVCVPHPPTAANKSTYGMPILWTTNGLTKNRQFFYFECPVCHRGGVLTPYKSAYLALNAWNKMQESLYEAEGKEIVFSDDFKKYTDPQTGMTLPEYRSKWDEN